MLACEEAFGLLKELFISAPILHHFDPSLPPIVKTNASDYTIAGILSVQTDDDDIHLVMYYSCTLTGAELNYNSTTRNSSLSSRRSRSGTMPQHTVDVIMDHKNLEYFSTTKSLTRCQA